MDPTTTLTKTSTKSSRSLCSGPIIVKLDSDNEHEIQVGDPSPLPLRPRVSGRALRRKKHLSIYRASAPPQSPVAEAVTIEIPRVRPQTMIYPASPIHEPPPLHPTRSQMHNRTYSQPTNNIRLGHPSRPYYSAIRKNTSRPNSPLGDSSMNPSPPTSLALPSRASLQPSPTSFGYIPNAFDDADDDDPLIRRASSHRRTASRFAFGLGGHSSSASALPSGFSVSGEMEMRMALAALASGEPDSDFHFQETGKMDSSVGKRMKRFSKGLKDLINKKHAA
ncbi:hypothetical protein C8F04DRAFT_253146 [Mycena alexandri]|uniref:Uncharacterized protein n=1 Tax=Mycena alexandri TaxID=1745969 RepID=A0AAD6T9L5_9AGAR|nr:hypothetical protein C8F04DRAFT_253146 [Mycena alexandri]